MNNTMATSYNATYASQMSSDEAALVRTAQKGDTDAFNQLVLTYQDRIYMLAVRILGDKDSAEDITQNTFLTAYLNLSRFRNGSFRSWIYRIATNLCYDEYRKHKRYPVTSLENDTITEENLSPLYDFSSGSVLPEVEVERREMERTIQRALNQLEPEHRAVLVLVDQLELEYQEAAQSLGIPVGTVKSRLARARLQLSRRIKEANDIDRFI